MAFEPRNPDAFYLRGQSHAFLGHQRDSIMDLTAAVRQKPGWGAAWTALGIAQEASGETALAIKSFTEAIKLNVRETDARFERACAYEKQGDYDKALDDLNTLIRLQPDHDKGLIRRVGLLMLTQPDICIADLNAVIERDRSNSEAWLLRGMCWRSVGDAERSLMDLDMACRLREGDFRPWLERGRVLLDQQRYDDAISDLSRVTQISPANADSHFYLSQAYQYLNQSSAAEANLRRAIELNPAHHLSRLALAELNVSLGDHEEALAHLQEVNALRISGSSGDDATESLPFRIQLEKARLLAATGRADVALTDLNALLEVRPGHLSALQLRADVLRRLNRRDEAVEDYSRLISTHAGPEVFLIERARLKLADHQLEQAMVDASTVLETQPGNIDALEIRARVYAEQGLSSLAIADLTLAIESDPRNAELLLYRSRLFDDFGAPVAAITDLQKALELTPGNEEIVTNLVARWAAQDEPAKAILCIDRAEELQNGVLSDTVRVLRADLKLRQNDAAGASEDLKLISPVGSEELPVKVLKARAAIAMQRYSDAEESLEGIPDADITSEVLLLRAEAMAFQGQLEESVEILSSCLSTSPQNIEALLLHARICNDLNHRDAAIASANELLDSKLVSQLTDAQRAEAMIVRGSSRFHQRHFHDALDDLDRLEVREFDTAALKWMRATCCFEVGQEFRGREELNALLRSDPEHQAGRLLRARLAEQKGEYDIAVEDLTVVLERMPDDQTLRLRRAVLLHRVGRCEEAVCDLTELLNASPEAYELYYRRGLARHQLRQSQDAVADLDQCLKLKPDFVDAIYVKGNITAAEGHPEEAIQLYREVAKIAPKHAASWYNQGNLLFHQEKLHEAVECWTKVIELQPDLFRAWNNRAAAFVKLGQESDAVADYERALALNPGFAKAWDNLAWLLATSEDPAIRDAVRAVTMAKKACNLTNSNDWSCMNTLAVAYAEAGDSEQAAYWARRSREAAPEEQHEHLDQLVRTYESSRVTRRRASTGSRNLNGQRN
ncbi:MAG: tetratricopeptide repeat protein [Planctomycetota bacterium]